MKGAMLGTAVMLSCMAAASGFAGPIASGFQPSCLAQRGQLVGGVCRMPLAGAAVSPRRGATLRMPTMTLADGPVSGDVEADGGFRYFGKDAQGKKNFRVVLMAGFETFNRELYKRAADRAVGQCDGLEIFVFTDADIDQNPEALASALDGADVFFGSLIFDFNQVNWLKDRIEKIPNRFVFESALELMSSTRVGSFSMATQPGKKQGMPPAVKALLGKFSSKREEDRLDGYTSFLKIGPKVLKYMPFEKAQDMKRWLSTYARWNAGGLDNVVTMLCELGRELGSLEPSYPAPSTTPTADEDFGEGLAGFFARISKFFADIFDGDTSTGALADPSSPPAVEEAPNRGLIHPSRPGYYFSSPREYLDWYHRTFPATKNLKVVGLLLYRKHVISELPYIPELISHMEKDGLLPLPFFITGVDAHIAVRDSLTSAYERQATRDGSIPFNPTLSRDAVEVDAVVSTIGFPLVGGPAGSMEGARQADLAKQILMAKNVPYFVAAPLLIQDVKSWYKQGIGGLQSVVLYSLPELDGAIDAIPLGGLCCGDKEFCESQRDLKGCTRSSGEIRLVNERLDRLTERIKKWTSLREKSPADRRVAVVLYGYPPGIGATGTAALLNVPKSLMALLTRLKAEGYDVGELPSDPEELLTRCREADEMSDTGRAFRNEDYTAGGGGTVTVSRLQEWMGKGDSARIADNWGGALSKSGIRTVGSGDSAELLLGGVQFGNVWVGVQPPLGLPGDPMRLLFERDMTPHPQYVAFYKYLEKPQGASAGFGADAVLHFGMHGTEEWLPGTPLGNTGECWPDILTGGLPNVYVYAANNPSESLLAKRRGYGTLVSHNVPPYSRAGLYKELQTMRGLISDYEETAAREASRSSDGSVPDEMEPSAAAAFGGKSGGSGGAVLTVDSSIIDSVGGGGAAAPTVEGALIQTLFSAGLNEDMPLPEAALKALESAGGIDAGESAVEECAKVMRDGGMMAGYVSELRGYLQELEQRLFSAGLHVLGEAPKVEEMRQYLEAFFQDGDWKQGGKSSTDGEVVIEDDGEEQSPRGMPFPDAVFDKIVGGAKEADVLSFRGAGVPMDGTPERDVYAGAIREACSIRDLLNLNSNELDGVVAALAGEYIPPAPGGDLLRDGSGVLPTGRNIHALDPYRMPSQVAMARGRLAANLTLEMHLRDNDNVYPETVAVNLWGLEAIKTRGESLGVVLALVGAEPVVEATGRVVRYDLIPLEKLGRPRIDVLASLSGIFRDSFANVVELLDDVLRRAAQAEDEDPEMNYIRKHALALIDDGEDIDGATARIFSNPPGEFGSLVNERVTDSSWEGGSDLGDTWASRNSFSFGKGGRGVNRRKTLDALMKTTSQVVQCLDSVEYGLTDIQEYYANTGAMVRAMDDIQGGEGKVQASILESYARNPRPKKLNDALRLEYRSKLLNPKWANTMVEQGSGGAFEVSQRMTALVGWGATTKFTEDWVYEQSAETYALDPEMAKKLMDANPEAFKNIVGRLIEANNRGMWDAKEDTIEALRDMYEDIDNEIELGSVSAKRLAEITSAQRKK